MRIIITGATGMVGEGVLLECLHNNKVTEILSISRKPCGMTHPKLQELIVPDFTRLADFGEAVRGYDACFYCAGISSVGMSEEKYHYITYDTTMAFAHALLQVNTNMVFCFVSGSHTDSTAKGKIMWARVKGKTENALLTLPFKAAYNFRPGGMLPYAGQKNAKAIYVFIVKLIKVFAPSIVLTLSELGKAMIHSVERKEVKPVLEVRDIKALAK